MNLRENKLTNALVLGFGIVSVVFMLCGVQAWGDMIINPQNEPKAKQKSELKNKQHTSAQSSYEPYSPPSYQATNTRQKDTKQSSLMHPLILGATYMMKSLHTDNFITLDELSESNFLEPKAPKLLTPHKAQEDTKLDTHSIALDSKPLDSKIPESSQNLESKPIKSSQITSSEDLQKPKVLLIMDDLSTAAQIKSLEKLALNITPSLFPATKQNATTPILAQKLTAKNKTYMLHLPLEAINFEQKELEPLRVGTSKQVLSQALQKIRQDFPALVYINNHTGSKFTQSKEDMHNLLEVMEAYNFRFIDSVTTPSIASDVISREQGRLIMQRDIFLDNEQKVAYTKKQLQTLIKKAQKSGYAIAICHPHSSTFKALSLMEGELLSKVELVSPQELEAYLTSQNITHYKRHKYYAEN